MKYIISIVIMLSIIACNDSFLDTYPTNKLSDGSFWKTGDDAKSAAIGVYNSLKDSPDGNPSLVIYTVLGLNKWTDDCTTNWPNAFYNPIALGSYDATNIYVERHWKMFYQIIRTCNVFMDHIKTPEMDETLRARLTGEVRFIRAYLYLQLLQLYGGVPLVTKDLDLTELKIPRNSQQEVFDFITKELEESAPSLPASYSSSEIGRVTRGAAYALLSRTYLYEGKWKEAAESASKVMNLGGYKLFPNYEEIFDTKNENNSEVIFDLQFEGEKSTSPAQTYLYLKRWGGWTGLCTLKSLVDAYECTDGKTIDQSPLYNENTPFENRDPRLKMSIMYPGTVFRGFTYDITNGPEAIKSGGSRSGLAVRKLLTDEYTNSVPNTTNIILIRYAEVLLNYAEAKIEAGNIDQSVLDAINSIRARAYGVSPENTNSYPAISTFDQNKLREIVRRERRIELAFEGNRFMDIRRWKIAKNVMNGPIYGTKLGGSYIKLDTRKFEDKHYLWPIPQSEIDLMGSDVLKQNPGW